MSGLDQARFREVLGHFATGITIVTASEQGEPVGFSCQSFAALSLDPPMVILAPAKSSTSWPRIAEAGAFAVNILAEHQEAICLNFAVSGGDKFDGVAWTAGTTGAPLIKGSLATIECTLGAIYEGGDHELVTGHVVAMEVGSGSPLLFYRSGFGRFVA
ncbi:MAG TPA: flavin reductase family protein [Acidimicrobiales bacterium]|jgi:3-hydroxy-9,10-secoandrosta-1,3,5(10)-triene-9,17-dione monooxygenase reductase component|nr:flavin reductase family protein [Acidimicrobiales bacterium]